MGIRPIVAFAVLALIAPQALAQSSAATALPRNAIAAFVAEAARRFAIPERWIYAVMTIESAGDPHAVSPKGATGLLQIMPETWRQLRSRYALGNDIYDPHDNIIAGAGYLRELYDRYGSPGFFAAYNAGPARYEKYLARGVELPGETIAYVRKLAPIARGEAKPQVSPAAVDPTAWTRSALFAGTAGTAVEPAERGHTPDNPPVNGSVQSRRNVPPPPGAKGLFFPLSGLSPR